MQRRFLLKATLVSSTAAAVGRAAAGDNWPQRPLKIIVVYPAGGLSDTIARAISEKLAKQLRVAVVVENRAGAGGSVGLDALSKSRPDGHTIAFSATSPITLTPLFSPASNTARLDIAPVMGVMRTPTLLVATPLFKGESFRDILPLSLDNADGLRWASSGTATIGHMVLEQVRHATGAKLTHIPYKGGGQQLTDALSGQFELLSTNVGALQLQYIAEGRLKPLAVGSAKRLASLPELRTFTELGCPSANLSSYFGFFAPAGTPKPIIHHLNNELNLVLRMPEIRQSLLSVDNAPAGGSSEQFAEWIAREIRSNQTIAINTGITAR